MQPAEGQRVDARNHASEVVRGATLEVELAAWVPHTSRPTKPKATPGPPDMLLPMPRGSPAEICVRIAPGDRVLGIEAPETPAIGDVMRLALEGAKGPAKVEFIYTSSLLLQKAEEEANEDDDESSKKKVRIIRNTQTL